MDRQVFDAVPVPGLAAFEGEPALGFFRDSYIDVNDHFYLDVRPAAELVSGSTSSGNGQVVLPNGAAIFRVYMDSPGFPRQKLPGPGWTLRNTRNSSPF